jgi:uncharacterized protein (TIGR00251 family)
VAEALIDIRVIPRAAKPGVAGNRAGAVLVRLASPPVEGAANEELIRILATALNVPRRSVAIVGGLTSRAKKVRVAGLSPEEVRSRLQL